MDSDRAWEFYGKTDPYYGVLTRPEFKTDQLNDEAKASFFESGQRYIDKVLSHVITTLDPSFRPTRALDFGCGVGRLALPLARRCESLVGVDVSDGMLEHARKNAAALGVSNATFVKSDDELSAVSGSFDFLNSLIVFQHIPPTRGEAILKKMLGKLREGGVGALQFTYSHASSTPTLRKLFTHAYTQFPLLWLTRNALKGRPLGEPMMQMNEYALNHLFRILHEEGCHRINTQFTETRVFGHGFYGILLTFQKQRTSGNEHL